MVQFILYSNVNKLYTAKGYQAPLLTWGLLVPGYNFVTGIRQIHFLSKFWAIERGEEMQPDAFCEMFPFATAPTLGVRELFTNPALWIAWQRLGYHTPTLHDIASLNFTKLKQGGGGSAGLDTASQLTGQARARAAAPSPADRLTELLRAKQAKDAAAEAEAKADLSRRAAQVLADIAAADSAGDQASVKAAGGGGSAKEVLASTAPRTGVAPSGDTVSAAFAARLADLAADRAQKLDLAVKGGLSREAPDAAKEP